MSRRRCTMLSWKRGRTMSKGIYVMARNGRSIRRRGHDCGLATIEYRLRRFSRFDQSDRRSVTPEAIASNPENRRILFEPRGNRRSIRRFLFSSLFDNDEPFPSNGDGMIHLKFFTSNCTDILDAISARFDYISHFEVIGEAKNRLTE